MLGINVPRMIFYTFAINALLAIAAALLVTPTYLAKFDMGESLGNKAFFAAIIGGFNNSRGALLGGLIVGVGENLAAAYVSPAYKDAVALLIFMVVILFKPQGLLGRGRAQGMKQGIAALLIAPGAGPAGAPSRAAVAQELRHLPVQRLAGLRHRDHGAQPDVGYAGQKSLGHAAFFGIGAYSVGASLMKAGIQLLARGCPLAVRAVLRRRPGLGFPALRVQTIYLAFATLGFNTSVWLVMRNEEWLTGGTFGINDIARPEPARLRA